MKVEFSGEITRPHKVLHKIIQDMGFQVVNNSEFDNYKIDCFIPELNIGVEADGVLYHKFKKKDRERDQYIFNKFNIPILRISEKLLVGKSNEEVIELIKEFIDNNANNKYSFTDSG